RAVARIPAEAPRHMRDAVGLAEVHRERDAQAVTLPRSVVERNAYRVGLRPVGRQQGPELGMRLAEVAGVAECGVGQPRVESAVAVGTEFLARRLHPPGALVLGVAVGAGAWPRLAERVGYLPLHGIAPRQRAAGERLARLRRVVGDILVAGQAGLVAHRDERLDVACLALVLEPVVHRAQRAGTPARVHQHRAGPGAIGLARRARQVRPDRYSKEGKQDR